MHGLIFEDRGLNYLAFSFPISGFTLGVVWLYFGVSDIQERDPSGQLIGHFDNSENAFWAGIGSTLFSANGWQLRAGLGARYFYQSMYNYRGTGLAADIGLLLSFKTALLFKKINLALTAQNLGARLKWNTPSGHVDDFPQTFRIGSLFELQNLPIKMIAEIDQNQYQDLRLHLGGECWFKQLALRAGLNNDQFSAGLGFVMRYRSFGLILDFALSADDISQIMLHFFSVNVLFIKN